MLAICASLSTKPGRLALARISGGSRRFRLSFGRRDHSGLCLGFRRSAFGRTATGVTLRTGTVSADGNGVTASADANCIRPGICACAVCRVETIGVLGSERQPRLAGYQTLAAPVGTSAAASATAISVLGFGETQRDTLRGRELVGAHNERVPITEKITNEPGRQERKQPAAILNARPRPISKVPPGPTSTAYLVPFK